MALRIIPCLLLSNGRLVKTTRFRSPAYIGDPVNTVRIFNELEVDELCFLDIDAAHKGSLPNYDLLQQLANECFMPLSYGGGITSMEQAQKILRAGFEKIVINTAAFKDPSFIRSLSERFGSQSIIVSMDVGKNILGQYVVRNAGSHVNDPVYWAQQMQAAGAGELLITSVQQEGSWKGFDVALVKKVAEAVTIPVIAHGGGGNPGHIRELLSHVPVNAVALGSMLVYQQKDRGVLINFPKEKIEKALEGLTI